MKKRFIRISAVVLVLIFTAISRWLTGLNSDLPATSTTSSSIARSSETQTGSAGNNAKDSLKVSFIDVGQADSILIQADSATMLIDAGNNADAETIINYIRNQGIDKLDYLIGTHPHEDHIGGMDAVIDTFDIGKIYMPKVAYSTRTFEDVLKSIYTKNMKVTTAAAGVSFKLGASGICEILAPGNTDYKDINNYSAVIKLTYKNTSFLFCGDAEKISEEEMLESNINLAADVLKVGHHGSASSTTYDFLKAVNPDYAVISVGKGNDYGHPEKKILDRLDENNITVYRTDYDGTIVCTSDGKNLTFHKYKGD